MFGVAYSNSSEDVTVKHGKQLCVTVKHLSVPIGGNSFTHFEMDIYLDCEQH